MIEYSIKRDGENIQEVTVSGHANYKPRGQDIICAAVSTSTFVTANAIKFLGLDDRIELSLYDGYFKIVQKEYDDKVNALLKNLEYTLSDISRDRSEFIKKIDKTETEF